MQELNAAMQAGTTQAVQYWMSWMVLVFLVSIFFVWKYKTARLTMLAMVLTVPIVLITWKLTKNVHLFGIAHLLVWTPLAVYIYMKEFKAVGGAFASGLKSPYTLWLGLLFTTIVISLVFDVRDIALVLIGQK